MTVIFTEEERSYLYSEINRQYQDWNYRSIEGNILKSILNKLDSVDVVFTQAENRRVQYLMQDLKELRGRLTDQRLQHILATQNSQGFGADKGGQEHFFNAGKQYNLCLSILTKLET